MELLGLLLILLFVSPFIAIAMLVQLSQRVEHITEILDIINTREMNDLLKLKDAGIFSEKEFETKAGICKRITPPVGQDEVKDAMQHMLEKGLLTQEEYEKKTRMLKDISDKGMETDIRALEELKRKSGFGDVVCFAELAGDSWICVCGTRNELSDINCSKCFRNQRYVLKHCSR